MKKSILTITAAALVMGFASCSKEIQQDGPNGPVVAEGKATTMQVAITFPTDSKTKNNTTYDNNATPNEAKVNTVDVFIYTGSGAFSSHTRLLPNDFEDVAQASDSDKYVGKTEIATTTGTKIVFVGINLPQKVVDACKSQPGSAIASTVHTLTHEEMLGAGHTSFIMFSKTGVQQVFVEKSPTTSNLVTVECERMVAKVTIETADDVDVSALPGTLSDLKFTINNFNLKFFLLQGAAPLYKDPNWAQGYYTASDFEQRSSHNHWYDVLDRKVFGKPDITDYQALYPPENTSEAKRKKEITRAVVRGAFIPDVITKQGATATEFVLDDNHGITTPQTFYAITISALEGTFFFDNATTAFNFANANRDKDNNLPQTFMYEDGLCYWHVYLNKNPQNLVNRWDILRNDFYRCVITKISNIGRPTPDLDPKEENETPDVDTVITVDIKVMFWHTPITSNYILE